MAELTKQQLEALNATLFPNNNTGFITADSLRTFNDDMITSLVDEIQYTADSGSFNARINALDPSGSAQALLSIEIATASLNAYTASQNIRNASYTSSISALQSWSSSLDAQYATDAQVSASVSALSSSVTVTTNGLSSSIGALQQFSSSLDNTYATDTQLSASASTLQNNITSLSQSVAVTDLAQSQSIAQLLGFSSSLDTTFATDAQLSSSVAALSSSVAVTDLAQSQSIAALQQFSSSLDSTFATDAQLSASVSSLSSSVAVTTLGLSASIAALDSGYATDTQLSASASTLQNDINTRLLTSSFQTYTSSVSTQIAGLGTQLNTKLNTSSFNSYTQSNDSKVNSLIAQTSSYAQASYVNNLSGAIAETDATQSQQIATRATTGSNTFNGNQSITGSVSLTGTLTALSASITYLQTIYETASVIYSSGSNQLGDELSDVQTLSGSVRVQGGLTVNGVQVQTSSFDASGYLLTSSFNQYTQSAASGVSASINSATQSLSSSIAVTTNNLDLEVNQKLDTGSFNTYTQSNDTKVNALINQTGSYAISSSVAATFDALSSSISLTYATETELSASASTLQNGINSKVENSTFNTYTQSQAAVNQGLTQAIATRLTTASFNSYTSSNDGKVNSLIAATGSYITSAQTSSMSVLSSSYSITASFALNAGVNVDTGSLVTTASFNAYTQSASSNVSASINSATQSLSSSIATTTSGLSSSIGNLSSSVAVTTNGLDLEVNGKLDSSSFNTYTQSNDSKVNSLISATGSYAISSSVAAINAAQDGQISSLTAQTSSYVTESETGSFARVNVSNVFTQNQTISGNLDVTGKITALSASITYLETIFQTSSVLFSSGSNILGDASNDTQTLFGKVDIKTGPLVITGSTFVSGNITLAQGSDLVTHHIQAAAANGVEIQNNSGNTAILVGAGGSLGTTFYGQINTTAISSSGNITGNLLGTASYANKALTASFAENVTPTDVSMFVSQSTFNSYTQSNDSKVNALISSTGSYTTTSSFNSYTQSNNSKVDTLIAATSSYITSAQTASMTVLSSSFATTASFALNAGASINTGSFATTGSNTFKAKQTIDLNGTAETNAIAIIGNADRVTTDMYVDGGNFDTFNVQVSASNGIQFRDWNNTGEVLNTFLEVGTNAGPISIQRTTNITGSLKLSGGSLIASGNLIVSGGGTVAQILGDFNAKVPAPALSVGVTTLDTLFESTASGVTSQIDFTRLGAGPTGDLTSVRLQTLSGSDTSGDTLLSRITTNVNRHTSTGMTGSVVTTLLTSQWATGSGGTRVTYGSTITVNAQSASSTITLAAGNAAANNNGGTASLQAGLIRLGSVSTHKIEVTGSFVAGGTSVFKDTVNITGSLNVSSSTGGASNFINGGLTIVGDNNGNALSIASGSVSITSPQGTGVFYSNLPITSSALRINGVALVNDLIISGVFSGNSTLQVAGNASVSGNLFVSGTLTAKGQTILSSSVRAEVLVGSVASSTASLNLESGNFFTVAGALGGAVHISPTNIRPGQTINIRVNTQSGSVITFPSSVKQPSGSAYTASIVAGYDILTMVTFDSTNVYLVAVKNLI